ncbi:Fic family protein [Bisgaard Taxon 45]
MNDKLPVNINDLIKKRVIEDERIEFKASWNPESIIHTLTATYEIQGKLILVLWAVGGEMRPYKAKKSLSEKKSENWAYYIRQHASTIEAKGEIEQELLSLANKIPFDDRLCLSAKLDDLQPYLIQSFLKEIKSDLASLAPKLSLEELAQRMNIVGGASEALFPKNVGLLFFNEQPERFFPATQIDVVYFPKGAGGGEIEEKIFKGPLGRITQDALQYIKSHYLQEKVIKIPNQAKAKRFWNYPFLAIEEALVNAVYHRSYEIREPIEVRIDDQFIDILSYPGPDRSIRLNELQAGRAVSRRYRNRRIGEFLKDLELTEGRSTGIPTIIKAMAENGSPTAIFESNEERSYFLIRLPIHPEMTSTVLATDLAIDRVDNLAVRLLFVLANHEKGISQLMEALNIQHKRHFRTAYILPAMENGWVEMTLPDKPTSPNQQYRMTEKGKQVLANIKNNVVTLN